VSTDLARLRETERWIAWVRLAAVPFALVEVGLVSQHYPAGYERWAWAATAALTVGAVLLFALSRSETFAKAPRRIGLLALTFDAAIVTAYAFVYQFEIGTPIRQLFFLVLVEAAVRYGAVGGVVFPLAIVPVFALMEWWRETHFPPPAGYEIDHVIFPWGILTLTGLIVGWLVNRLLSETGRSEARATEAEQLRDELGRRADVVEAASRCARALSSSLDLDEAFDAFIRELRSLVRFDRVALVLADEDVAHVMAVAGEGAERIFPPGTKRPVTESLLDDILTTPRPVYREDMADQRYPEERELVALGLRSRLAVPLLLGARPIGMLSLVRAEPRSFTREEIELAGLLGRLVASAVQNIRAYEAERRTVEELRRLSALRADFVSLVSHELRTPMAAVIGSAMTLQQRWRELAPEQRESFLALIAGETNRLATLVGDVLDTSRIEAGTFTYRFSDVDIGDLVRETVATTELGQDEVRVRAELREPLPRVRGDRDRLRQVLMNLIENAVKYSPAQDEVEVRVYAQNGRLQIDVRDHGPGIAKEDQKLIFEKFGRVNAGGAAKPGTGLGLFIARSIAEAHGGSLDVSSAPEHGATFTLALPA
jgi:signal transduction histidine kinase